MRALLAVLIAVVIATSFAGAEVNQKSTCDASRPMGDAWWTGPMLANTAATAPRGHYLIEPYLYDVTTQGSYNKNRTKQPAAHANSYGSLTYIVYGLTDKWGVGLIPTAGYNQVSNGPGSAGTGMGDLTLQVQHRLTQFEPCGWIPTISIAVQETLPTGKYDRLGNRPSNAFGAGAYTTNLAFYSQMYFWLPNHRILRTRFNVSNALSGNVHVKDVSVYGTEAGFRGTAHPGNSFFVDASWEYSLARSWVLALDATYRHNGNTRIAGYYVSDLHRGQMNSGTSEAYGVAPAIEYSWKPYIGVLLGVRMIPAGRNTSETITPAVAINFVH